MMLKWTIFGLLFALAFAEPEISLVTRSIDLSKHVTKVKYEIAGFASVGDTFQFLVDKIHEHNVANIVAKVASNSLKLEKMERNKNGFTGFRIKLPSSVKQDSILQIDLYLFEVQTPKPSEALQSEKHYAKFSANSFIISPYLIKSQTTKLNLPRGQMLMYTAPEKPVTKSDYQITYGPYENRPGFSEAIFSVQYEIKSQFLTVTKMSRLIEVSHWGNIAVEEDIDIVNSGAVLKGPFSRLDFMQGIGMDSCARNWISVLPASARDIYYRDLIGNVSTSTVDTLYSAKKLDITPRFPLMGGWRTRYTIGYNVPAHEYLYRDGSKFALKMRVIDHIYDSQLVKDFTLNIVLPEAVSNIKLHPPFAMERLPDSKMPTYMDTTGREVVTLRAENLVESHIQEFTLTYEFTMNSMVREFLMAIGAFMMLFVAIMIYVRLDFTISKNAEKDTNLRTQALINQLFNEHDRRKNLYLEYDETIANYKVNKNMISYSQSCKRLDADLTSLSGKIISLSDRLRILWSEGAEKVQELQSLDKKYHELVQKLIKVTEQLVSGKISKSEYQESDNEIQNKKMSLVDNMDSILKNL